MDPLRRVFGFMLLAFLSSLCFPHPPVLSGEGKSETKTSVQTDDERLRAVQKAMTDAIRKLVYASKDIKGCTSLIAHVERERARLLQDTAAWRKEAGEAKAKGDAGAAQERLKKVEEAEEYEGEYQRQLRIFRADLAEAEAVVRKERPRLDPLNEEYFRLTGQKADLHDLDKIITEASAPTMPRKEVEKTQGRERP